MMTLRYLTGVAAWLACRIHDRIAGMLELGPAGDQDAACATGGR